MRKPGTCRAGKPTASIGRPHPDGAVALLFEDISTEMSRTRRYRADVELGQSVIDAMDEAVAVFSSVGLLVLSNTAYVKLWGHDPQETLGEVGIAVVSAHWRSHTAPSAIWARAEDFVTTLGERQAWSEEARLNDGRLMACRFMPAGRWGNDGVLPAGGARDRPGSPGELSARAPPGLIRAFGCRLRRRDGAAKIRAHAVRPAPRFAVSALGGGDCPAGPLAGGAGRDRATPCCWTGRSGRARPTSPAP